MSEKLKKTEQEQEQEATPAKKPAPKKAEAKTEKKENWFKRTGKKVKKGMSEHPFWTAFGGAALGSAATVGIGYGGKKLVENHRAKKAAQNPVYVQDDSLDPNL